MRTALSGRSTSLRLALAAALGGLLLLAPPEPAAAQTMPQVTLSYVTENSSVWPGIVAREKKFFEEEGIKVDWVRAGQSAKALQMVAAKAAHIANASVVDTFRAIDNGAGVVSFLNGMDAGLHYLIAAKNITSVEQLKGKRIITGGQKDITNLWWLAMARKHGLDPAKDVDILYAGSTTNRMAALVSGGVEAAVISPPQNFQLLEQGFSNLGPMAPALGPLPIMTFSANRDWAKDNRDVLIRFVRAHNRAVEFMNVNRQEASEIIARASNTSLEDALKTYDIAQEVNAYRADGVLTEEGIRNALSNLAADGDLKNADKPPSFFYDETIAKAAAAR